MAKGSKGIPGKSATGHAAPAALTHAERQGGPGAVSSMCVPTGLPAGVQRPQRRRLRRPPADRIPQSRAGPGQCQAWDCLAPASARRPPSAPTPPASSTSSLFSRWVIPGCGSIRCAGGLRSGGLDAWRIALSRRGAQEGQTEPETRGVPVIGDKAMAKHGPGRPKGSKNAVDVVVVERSHCPKCGSARRSEYWGRMVQKCPGHRASEGVRHRGRPHHPRPSLCRHHRGVRREG